MNVKILVPLRKGGPKVLGTQLVEKLCEQGINAKLISSIWGYIKTMIWPNCDIVHSMDIPLPFLLKRTPLLLSLHGEYPKQNTFWKSLYPPAIRRANHVTVPSEYLNERLGISAEVIPNAIDVSQFTPISHRSKKLVHIVTVTKFHFPDKASGVIQIVRILKKVQKHTKKKIKYTVIGGGKYLDSVKKYAHKSTISIKFTGQISDPRTILHSADIFAYYSQHDSFGVVLLEAMAAGLPVIVNGYGPFKEIIQSNQNGIIAQDKMSYEKNLTRLVESSALRKSLGSRARKKVTSMYTWNKSVSKHIKLYRKIV